MSCDQLKANILYIVYVANWNVFLEFYSRALKSLIQHRKNNISSLLSPCEKN